MLFHQSSSNKRFEYDINFDRVNIICPNGVYDLEIISVIKVCRPGKFARALSVVDVQRIICNRIIRIYVIMCMYNVHCT